MKGLGVLALLLAVVLYFVPSIVALVRGRQGASVIVINFFLGWTLIGWVAALALAVSSGERGQQAPPGYPPVYPPSGQPPVPWYPQAAPQPQGPPPWDQNQSGPQQYWQPQPDQPSSGPQSPPPPHEQQPPNWP